jgi:hypothetical protein
MKKLLVLAAIAKFTVFSCWATEGYNDLAKLVKSGVGEDVVIAFVNASNVSYALTPDEILQLKDMGATDKVLTAVIQKKIPAAAVQSQKSAPSAVSPNEAAKGGQADAVQSVPPTGNWVLMNDYWYWQYPTGVIVDLGWQPYYYYGHRWYPRGHWGRRGW